MKILAIGAHMDDVEIGCGGTLAKLIDKGHEVFYIALSDCDNPFLADECKDALQVLGINKFAFYSFKRRIMCLNRQEILDLFLHKKKTIQPDIVFTHSSTDFHQDHKVVYEESLRAFKDCTVLGYNFPWNQITSNTHLKVKVDIAKKVEALSKYRSQAHREYFKEDYIMATNFFGENFEVIKLNEIILV